MLFGKLVLDLKILQDSETSPPRDTHPRGIGENHFLRDQIEKIGDPRFARIYGFSYEGVYYDMPRPALFLVDGEGEPVTAGGPPQRGARAPAKPSMTGLGAADFQFAADIEVWFYDKADFTIRMDVATGTFEDVLLEAQVAAALEMGGAARMQAGGAARMQTGAARMQISHAARMLMGGGGGS
jgi:hypothetical protein